MRVLTVQQPWAWAIFHGKDVENRTQAWGYRGPVAIHAGQRISQRGMESLVVGAAARQQGYVTHQPPLPLGVVLGVVQLVDVHHAHPRGDGTLCCPGPWPETSYLEHGGRTRRHLTHLVLKDPVEFAEPIPNVRGRLGLWTPDDDLADAIAAGLEASR